MSTFVINSWQRTAHHGWSLWLCFFCVCWLDEVINTQHSLQLSSSGLKSNFNYLAQNNSKYIWKPYFNTRLHIERVIRCFMVSSWGDYSVNDGEQNPQSLLCANLPAVFWGENPCVVFFFLSLCFGLARKQQPMKAQCRNFLPKRLSTAVKVPYLAE